MTQNDTGVPDDDQGCTPDDIVYVIQSNYPYNDADNRRAVETRIVEDEGWFATEEAARSRAEILGQASMTFYEGEGLKLTGRGKWRTTECKFHGGSDSMRVNTESGAFCCMAGCGARGGDVLAYYMAQHGMEFVEAAKALGAWVDDGRPPTQHRPTPLTPRQALEVLAYESNLVAYEAARMARGALLTVEEGRRLLTAANRISKLAEVFT